MIIVGGHAIGANTRLDATFGDVDLTRSTDNAVQTLTQVGDVTSAAQNDVIHSAERCNTIRAVIVPVRGNHTLRDQGVAIMANGAVVSKYRVVTRTGGNYILAAAADDHVTARTGRDVILTGKDVRGAGQERIARLDRATVTNDSIVSIAQIGRISQSAKDDKVIAAQRRHHIITIARNAYGRHGVTAEVKDIVANFASIAKDRVITRIRIDCIVAAATDNHVCCAARCDQIITAKRARNGKHQASNRLNPAGIAQHYVESVAKRDRIVTTPAHHAVDNAIRGNHIRTVAHVGRALNINDTEVQNRVRHLTRITQNGVRAASARTDRISTRTTQDNVLIDTAADGIRARVQITGCNQSSRSNIDRTAVTDNAVEPVTNISRIRIPAEDDNIRACSGSDSIDAILTRMTRG